MRVEVSSGLLIAFNLQYNNLPPRRMYLYIQDFKNLTAKPYREMLPFTACILYNAFYGEVPHLVMQMENLISAAVEIYVNFKNEVVQFRQIRASRIDVSKLLCHI